MLKLIDDKQHIFLTYLFTTTNESVNLIYTEIQMLIDETEFKPRSLTI